MPAQSHSFNILLLAETKAMNSCPNSQICKTYSLCFDSGLNAKQTKID